MIPSSIGENCDCVYACVTVVNKANLANWDVDVEVSREDDRQIRCSLQIIGERE